MPQAELREQARSRTVWYAALVRAMARHGHPDLAACVAQLEAARTDLRRQETERP